MISRPGKELSLIFILLATTAAIYYPGLSGIFLLDDYVNLPQLEIISGPNDWQNILAYILNGVSSTLGRPVSLLSFALQADAWQSQNAFVFKLVNLIIHLFNGLLIYLLARRILQLHTDDSRHISLYNLLISTVWLLHPLQVSTVLYVVQRMTELAALFTLAGILLYLHGRTITEPQQWRKSWFYMTLGIGTGLLLGILSKENAILICLYIGALELTVLAATPRPRYWRSWATLFLAAPMVALVVYLTPDIINHLNSLYPSRTFGPVTRLLTETRILMEYLGNIVLPRPAHFGIFHSDYTVSENLLQPLSTLFSTLFLAALLLFAIIKRKSLPVISLGILWFFAGHALESTVLNLELYFEHRNYLPLFGVAVAIVGLARQLLPHLQRHRMSRGWLIAGIVVWSAFTATITLNETRLWGDPILQAATWAEEHPHSYRTQGYYADVLTSLGEYEHARALLEQHTRNDHYNAAYVLLWLNIRCYSDDIEPPSSALLEQRLKSTEYNHSVIQILDTMIERKRKNSCSAVSDELLGRLIVVLQENRHYQNRKVVSTLYTLLGKLYTFSGRYAEAVQAYSQAYQLAHKIDLLISVAEIHLGQGNRDWFVQTMAMLNRRCAEAPLRCLPYGEKIAQYNDIVTRLSALPDHEKKPDRP